MRISENDYIILRYGFSPVNNEERLLKILNGEIKGIIDCNNVCFDEGGKNTAWQDINGIRVCNSLYYNGFNENYLSQSIIDKDVYSDYIGINIGIPINNYTKLILVNKGEELPEEYKKLAIGKINYVNEQTVGDLYCNFWKYKHNIENGNFDYIENEQEAKQNLAIAVISRKIFEWSGNSNDRIADYARIILFLLSKIELTDEEKEIIDPLLNYVPDNDKLKQIVDKEVLIQKEVKKLKDHFKNL